MIPISANAYEMLQGNISDEAVSGMVACMSQCTGCMCNCRCSCSGGVVSDFEWEVI